MSGGAIPGDVLRYRLPRESPWSAAVGCSFALGLVLILIAAPILYFAYRDDDDAFLKIFGFVFGGVGLLVIASGVHQSWAIRQTAETWLEVDTLDIERGREVRFCVLQPGPADLQSIRMNVLCMEERVVRRKRDDGYEDVRYSKLVHQHNVLEALDVLVASGDIWKGEGTLVVPADQPPSGAGGQRGAETVSYEWRLEIWGRVRRGPDVMHPFVIVVR